MTSAKRFVGGLIMTLGVASAAAREIVLQERLKQQWTNELVTVAFEAGEGQCHRDSIRLTGPRGPVPVQVSDPTFWPGSKTFVRTAKLSFIVDLAPLARDVYTVSYDTRPDETEQPPTDLTTTRAEGSVEFATSQFAVRLLAGTKQYGTPINSTEAPGPVVGMRLGVRPSAAQADGTWFGGSRMTGPSKISAWSAEVTDNGPLFARAMIRYTYAHGNTMDLTVQVVAGDNTMRMETLVANDQPRDGFDLVLSRNLPPLLFQVQDERRKDRPCFMDTPKGTQPLKWAEIPLTDYVVPDEMTWCPVGNLPGLVTSLTPWEDWFGTFTQTRIRLKLEGTKRELQLRSLDAGAWVEPREIEAVFDPSLDADPRRGIWVGWNAKCMPILRGESGEVYAQVNAAQGVRKWTVSDCLSVPGAAALYNHHGYEPESTFPPETRPLVGRELNKVKDYVLDWEGDAGKHPRLYVSRADLESLWERGDADPEVLEPLLKRGTARSVDRLAYMPNTSYSCALGAYLLTGSSEIAEQTLLLARTHKTLTYDIWGIQFGSAGKAPTLYDGIVDSPAIPDEERPLLRARMAYFAYRLMEARVWSAERGYCSGNANMTVTWEIPRGIVACTIAEHPMARTWYRKAERIMELFLDRMVGPAGE
ncbi:MAG: hypothetical protein HON70_10435 [Lentisphaerae bacterium]|nr:hypothetical protein [Lentisphaerota bacterium]